MTLREASAESVLVLSAVLVNLLTKYYVSLVVLWSGGQSEHCGPSVW